VPVAARDPRLTARVIARRPLVYAGGADGALDRPAHVRSASGLARWQGRLAVVSDDANFVGLVDPADGRCHPITLPVGAGGRRQFDDGRGNKAGKLDLESLFVDDDRLIALGSDSGLAVRRQAIVVDDDGARAIAIPRLYAALRRPELGRGQLNLEGATGLADDVALGNRGGDVGDDGAATRDAIAYLPRAALRALLADPAAAPLPPVRWQPIALGELAGVALRLTELEAIGGRIFYTATAEATTSAYHDGPVAGSAVGVIDGEVARWVAVVDEAGAPLAAKLEGLVADGDHLLASVDADDPGAPSALLTLALDGPW
jgi:hypothetical protein